MKDADPGFLGNLTDVSGARFIARLQDSGPNFEAYRQVGGEIVSIGQIGTYVIARGQQEQVLCQIISAREEGHGEDTTRMLRLLPLGEISSDGKFFRGVGHYPPLGTPVYMAESAQLDAMFDGVRRYGLHLGRLSQREELRVFVEPNLLFSRHLAILGQSGSGKSWAVSSLLQRTVKLMPKAHIVLLDLHGEYGWRDEHDNFHSAFPVDIVRHVDARSLEIPYWLLTYGELVDLLIDRTDPNASLQISFMREVLHSLRKKGNEYLGIDRLSVDSPVYFSLKELYLHFKQANEQQFDFGKTQGPLFGAFDEFLVRFQSMFNDSRYDFLFRPKRRTKSLDLEDLLRDFIGLGEPKRQITVIDLSAVPHDVRPTVSSQIGRLAFEFNYWNPQRREFPILLVCEEAHQYIPRQADTQHEGSRRAMERIAKEGRKYAVGLCVISQRPTELSETVLSQCSNFICLRTTNPQDQEYIRKLMPEGEQDLADVLTTLHRGEALAVGEAIPLPTRLQLYPPNPAPASSDAPVAESWKSGPDDLNVASIVDHWWRQQR
ncbi:MAG: ATP-binding protein [Gammaproteobacteria bacterium]|jgi:DNA helicase HerA-like ATPase|nr:ATP-binding protein [Gammaproteobacteria bacterium]